MLRGTGNFGWHFLAMLLITGLYALVLVLTREIPPASELFGHGIGIVGFIFMLMTETLYSLRKRSRSVKWGRMSRGCSFISSPARGTLYGLLHTSWKFNGLAGVTTLFTVIIVVSGFIGRYIFHTASHARWTDSKSKGHFRRRALKQARR